MMEKMKREERELRWESCYYWYYYYLTPWPLSDGRHYCSERVTLLQPMLPLAATRCSEPNPPN